jgi:nicotinamidase-related amidase
MNPSHEATDRAALVLMDFHAQIVDWHGAAGQQAVLAAAIALEHARGRQLAIFHVVPNYRPDYPELPDRAPFDAVKTAGLFREANPAAGIAPELAPGSGEAVAPKRRYSPFFANDLLHLLRMREVRTLVFAGIATSGVVLSAVRDAWDRDFRSVVLSDACADPDADVHQFLITKLLPPQATVLSVADWCRSAGTAGQGH